MIKQVTQSDQDDLLTTHFKGQVVRKDLVKQLKEGTNVPVYVLEHLLRMSSASDDDELVNDGIENVKKVLAENCVHPGEAQKIISLIREHGTYMIIDKVSIKLNQKKNAYEAMMSNLGVKDAVIPTKIVKENEKLLTSGIWCTVTIQYLYEEGQERSSFSVMSLKPIQSSSINVDELFKARQKFTTDQWINCLIRSIGLEPQNLEQHVKWHLLTRMIPFVENNYNLCELGSMGTDKRHIYKECSPRSLLVSDEQITVAQLFYNLINRQMGLVGMRDVIAFDKAPSMSFKDEGCVQIMKEYMASGSFAGGGYSIEANASMAFIGNINHSENALIDSTFFDCFHACLLDWDVPKICPGSYANSYGLTTDYLAGYMCEMRKYSFSDVIDQYFKLGNNLNQQDVIAVQKTTSGLIKLIYPNGEFDKEAVRACLTYALKIRRQVKEQIKRISSNGSYDVCFSYIDNDSLEESFVSSTSFSAIN